MAANQTLPTHRNDSPGSQQAARRHAEQAESHRAIILAWVMRYPGYTSKQIAEFTGIERHEAGRRLPELRDTHKKLISKIGDDGELTWWPAPEKAGVEIKFGDNVKLL